ncbi:hypothetical protein [Desulfoluna spongiiphila]|uniref:TRAP-type C4-dicarboxylate transport system, substrate-binding protein n=1 Tax=Desulfoluna spongiiphila TaxID=419481 RepID=A0A1G5GI97_9BACT|nr:hypothetical protein [Desulfoluna spongiiphila]SCY51263.1 TRAP-type C4-dicarboxylate transport system, substrate-binding protein [Desulfoluna spongiiphila]
MLKQLPLALIVLVSLTCPTADAEATQILRIGMSAPPESDQGIFARRFKTIVESLSRGEIRVSVFADSAFGNDPDLLDHLRSGSLAAVTVSTGNAVASVEELGTLALPGLVETHEEAVKATTGSTGSYWNELCMKKGNARILGWSYSGPRTVYAPGPLPRTPDRLRDFVVSATFTEWEAGTATTRDSLAASAHKDAVPLYRYYRMHPFVIGGAAWRQFSPEHRDILVQAGREAQQYAILMQALKPVDRQGALTRPALTNAQLQNLIWPEFYDLLGGKGPITRVLDAITWR